MSPTCLLCQIVAILLVPLNLVSPESTSIGLTARRSCSTQRRLTRSAFLHALQKRCTPAAVKWCNWFLIATVFIDGQELNLLVDTGSDATWAIPESLIPNYTGVQFYKPSGDPIHRGLKVKYGDRSKVTYDVYKAVAKIGEFEIIESPFGLATKTNVITEDYQNLKMTGILGLGLLDIYERSNFHKYSFLRHALNLTQIGEDRFSIWINPGETGKPVQKRALDGKLWFGSRDCYDLGKAHVFSLLYSGENRHIPLLGRLHVFALVNNVEKFGIEHSVFFDTATTYIELPTMLFAWFKHFLERNRLRKTYGAVDDFYIECSDMDKLPALRFKSGAKSFDLEPEYFVQELEQDHGVCVVMVRETAEAGRAPLTLGMSFFLKHYTETYQSTNEKRILIAPAKDC